LTFANVPATASPRTIRPSIGKPTTIITWPITHSRQSAKPRPRRPSSTFRIVIAERRRTMVEKSRPQHCVANGVAFCSTEPVPCNAWFDRSAYRIA
jgi:hypothetical protein